MCWFGVGSFLFEKEILKKWEAWEHSQEQRPEDQLPWTSPQPPLVSHPIGIQSYFSLSKKPVDEQVWFHSLRVHSTSTSKAFQIILFPPAALFPLAQVIETPNSQNQCCEKTLILTRALASPSTQRHRKLKGAKQCIHAPRKILKNP